MALPFSVSVHCCCCCVCVSGDVGSGVRCAIRCFHHNLHTVYVYDVFCAQLFIGMRALNERKRETLCRLLFDVFHFHYLPTEIKSKLRKQPKRREKENARKYNFTHFESSEQGQKAKDIVQCLMQNVLCFSIDDAERLRLQLKPKATKKKFLIATKHKSEKEEKRQHYKSNSSDINEILPFHIIYICTNHGAKFTINSVCMCVISRLTESDPNARKFFPQQQQPKTYTSYWYVRNNRLICVLPTMFCWKNKTNVFVVRLSVVWDRLSCSLSSFVVS